jgi:hypothetical protein
MNWDRGAKKKNLSDARRMSRFRRMPLGDAMSMFPGKTKQQLDATWAEEGLTLDQTRSREEKRRRDEHSLDMHDDSQEVTIVHIQWKEREHYWLVADPTTQQMVEMSEADYRMLAYDMVTNFGLKLEAVKMTRLVFKSAFLGSDGLLKPVSPAPLRTKFSWDCITGERDKSRTNGTEWFGLVKLLRDPQMWANKWLSQILHMLNTSAKGGIIAEVDAFEDQRQAEDSWARTDIITWAEKGALSGPNPKIKDKVSQTMTDGYLGLMTFAISSFKDVSGLNMELMGQQDQNQPGVVEAMRKQAGMTVLATLFDSLRRYRKFVGRGRLIVIQNFLSDGRLIRITNSEGEPEAVRLMKEKTTGEYDVVVAQTPTSPNQKEANWLIIQPMMVNFRDQLMSNPQVFLMLLEYSPLPSRVVQGIKTLIEQQMNDPKMQQEQEETKQLTNALMDAAAKKDASTATLNVARASTEQAKAMEAIAKAKKLLADNGMDGTVLNEAKALESIGKARKLTAEAERASAQTQREMTEAEDNRLETISHAERYSAEADRERSGAANEQLESETKALRNIAAARKDIAQARSVTQQ